MKSDCFGAFFDSYITWYLIAHTGEEGWKITMQSWYIFSLNVQVPLWSPEGKWTRAKPLPEHIAKF